MQGLPCDSHAAASDIMQAIQHLIQTSSYELDGRIGAVPLRGNLADELQGATTGEQLKNIYGLLARLQSLIRRQLFPDQKGGDRAKRKQQQRLEHRNLLDVTGDDKPAAAPVLPVASAQNTGCNPILKIVDACDTRLDSFRQVRKSNQEPGATYHSLRVQSVLQADRALEAKGLFLVQSNLIVDVLLRHAKYQTLSVLATQTKLDKLPMAQYNNCRCSVNDESTCSCPTKYSASEDCIQEVAGNGYPVDCMALAKRPDPKQATTPLQQATAAHITCGHSTIVALERVNKSENVGSIARSALALGVTTMLVCPSCADPLSRKSVRASMGAILRMPFSRSTTFAADLGSLKSDGYGVIATCLSDKAITFDQLPKDFCWTKVVLLLGNEGDGLSEEALQLADFHVQIEMEDPHIDSLGVAHAAAVAFAAASNARKAASTAVRASADLGSSAGKLAASC
jgi:tRNA G18 (ribose-2'-O)-methylase SpoU